MFKFIICFIVSIVPVTLFGQRYISGRITDAENSEPIPGASVFIANTTIGTVTDGEGYYHLKVPGEGNYRLAVSHVGYQPVFKDIEYDNISVTLDVSMILYEIEEVTVTANVRFRQRDINLFWTTILGKLPSQKTIHAINPESVYYYYNSETRILKVTCREPLQIINNETGYHIQLVVDHFTYDYTTNTSIWVWERKFEELEPENHKQKMIWEENRKKIYQSSVIHFIKSLYHNSLIENGFLLTYQGESIRFDHHQYSVENPNPYLVIDSIDGHKTFHIPSDLELMLVCFGRPLNKRDFNNIDMAQQRGRFDWSRFGLYRNFLKTPEPVQIFPDGTYKNLLQVNPCFLSNSLLGLNMRLPTDYIPDIDSDAMFSASEVEVEESHIQSAISALQDYTENHPVEKIYLHLDKPYYAAGEYMYFRAYLTDMHLNQANVESRKIYVELSDAERKMIRRVLLYSEDNEYAAQILLPDSLPSANYHLRAYTNWMRNAGEDYFYHRDIYIGNTSGQKQEESSQEFDYQVSFFPEGGHLLAGFPNKIAFKALGNDGFGTETTGILTDEGDNELLRFNSQQFGMGSFNFTPEKGKTYRAIVQSGRLQKEYTLPATTEGLTMSVKQTEQSIYLTIRSTDDEPVMISLIGQSRHTVCHALEGVMEGREQLYRVEKNKFPTGIAQFTLFKDNHPVNERLVFIEHKDDLHVDIIPDKEKYGDREKATVQIRITDSEGQPVAGSFSLSVTDDKTVQPSINQQNIKGSLLLDADLKGYIESPGWYFTGDEPERAQALDNLLCTQGWSRFVWDKLETSYVSIYPVESGFQITGKVTGLTGNSVKDASVILFSKENVPGTATTDKEGRFGFFGFDCPDSSVFVLQCRTKNDRKTLIGFKLDQTDNRQVSTSILPLTQTENKRNHALIEAYTEQAIRQINNEEDLWTLHLSEVKIEADRIPNRMESIGAASYRLRGKMLEKPYPIQFILRSAPPIVRGITSVNAIPRVKYIVDGMKLNAEEFEREYASLPAYMFESVDILREVDSFSLYGFDASGGAYVIKTKTYRGNHVIPDASIEIYRPEGYCIRKEFYIPAYDQPEVRQRTTPDFRTTIYWNPVVRTNASGEAEVSFYTADYTASYSYVLEGIGDNKVIFTR